MASKRLRVFAGPNGSGKSTIKAVIPTNLLGFYLNPDEIENEVKHTSKFDTKLFSLQITQDEIVFFFKHHPLIHRTQKGIFIDTITCDATIIDFSKVGFDSYLSAILTDFLRKKLLERGDSFTFETVMSSEDKIEILQKAQRLGFRTYLYYVATEDPDINLTRIQHRVKTGGHSVPSDKVISRYYRSLDLLFPAIKASNRAYIFDNSGESRLFIAEIGDGNKITILSDTIPTWFQQYVLDKI